MVSTRWRFTTATHLKLGYQPPCLAVSKTERLTWAVRLWNEAGSGNEKSLGLLEVWMKQLGFASTRVLVYSGTSLPCISRYESVWDCVLQRRWRLRKTLCTAGSRSLWQEPRTLNLQPNTKRNFETPKLWKQKLQIMFTWWTPPVWPVGRGEIQTETVVFRNRMGGGQRLFQSRNWWGSLWVAQDLCGGHMKSNRTEIRDANMSFSCDSTRLALFSLRERNGRRNPLCVPPGSRRLLTTFSGSIHIIWHIMMTCVKYVTPAHTTFGRFGLLLRRPHVLRACGGTGSPWPVVRVQSLCRETTDELRRLLNTKHC